MSLYVWGSNKLKQLNTLKELHCYTPGFIPSTCGDNVPTVVAAGENHTLILCESGDVYAFGRGSEGQLGNGNADAAAEANIVSGLNEETIVDIAAGSASSYAVTSTGNVYQWYDLNMLVLLMKKLQLICIITFAGELCTVKCAMSEVAMMAFTDWHKTRIIP